MGRETIPFDTLYFDAPAPADPGIPPEVSVIAHSKPALLLRAGHEADLQEIRAQGEVRRCEMDVDSLRYSADTSSRYIFDARLRQEQMAERFRADFGDNQRSEDFIAERADDTEQHISWLTGERDTANNGMETALSNLAILQQQSVEATETKHRVRAVDRTREKLGRGALALAFAPGALFGVGVVEGYLHGLDAYAENVHSDASIFPGNQLPVVPGFTDVDGQLTRYEVRDGKTIVITKLESSDASGSALNPAAPNFQLTGQEIDIDKQALRPVFQFIHDQEGRIASISYIGLASDEAAGADANLGYEDPQGRQKSLGGLRADAGRQAGEQLAAEIGVEIDEDAVTTEGREVVLTAEQITNIDNHAAAAGLSRQELLARHRAGQLPADSQAVKDLQQYIDNNRGIQVIATVEAEVPELAKSNDEVVRLVDRFGVAGEGVAAFLGVYLGMFSRAMWGEGIQGRMARRRARNILDDPESKSSKKLLDRLAA